MRMGLVVGSVCSTWCPYAATAVAAMTSRQAHNGYSAYVVPSRQANVPGVGCYSTERYVANPRGRIASTAHHNPHYAWRGSHSHYSASENGYSTSSSGVGAGKWSSAAAPVAAMAAVAGARSAYRGATQSQTAPPPSYSDANAHTGMSRMSLDTMAARTLTSSQQHGCPLPVGQVSRGCRRPFSSSPNTAWCSGRRNTGETSEPHTASTRLNASSASISSSLNASSSNATAWKSATRAFSTAVETDISGAAPLYEFLNSERWQSAIASNDPAKVVPLKADILQMLDGLRAEDLGVHPSQAASLRGRCGLGYIDVHTGSGMTICIFLLRAGSKLPMHDHPGMHVFGRLLFGRLRVTSFDIESSQGDPWNMSTRYLAVHRGEKEIGPNPVTYSLAPDDGNLHEIEALDDSAFFDILTPSYDAQQGRDCNYYKCEAPVGDGRFILTPTYPSNFYMSSVPYEGPPFVQ